jgi:hypothetical protein
MASVQIGNSIFQHTFSAEQLQSALVKVASANQVAGDLDSNIVNAIASGVGAGQTLDAILFSPESILHSAIRANRKIKPHRRATLNWCLSLAGSLSLAAPIDEPVRVSPREKKGGVLGVTLDFGLKHRTAQDIIKRIMSRHLKPRPFQYGLRGVHKAIAAVKELVAAGYIHAARLDIKDFFGSFHLEKLAPELPLPQEVVKHAVVGRHYEVYVDQSKIKGQIPLIHTHHYDNLITLARQGLPPGSGCSPIIAEFTVSKLVWSTSAQVAIGNFCDDWLILASSSKHLDEAVGALTDAVSKLPGGQFQLLLLDQGSALEGFRFLGHCIQLANDLVQTTVDPKAVFSLNTRLKELDQKYSDLVWLNKPAYKSKANKEAAAIALLAEMAAILQGWRAAFREADDVDRHTNWCETIVADNVAALGLSPDQVAATIDDSMRYHPADYALEG